MMGTCPVFDCCSIFLSAMSQFTDRPVYSVLSALRTVPFSLYALTAALSLSLALAHPSHAYAAAPTSAAQSVTAQAAVQQVDPLRVLVAHPVVRGLARQICEGTSIQLHTVVPERLPASRQPSYLAGRGLDALLAAAADAQAVLGLRSVWPDDQLYPLARRANIRIVEIDAANPVEGDLPGISIGGGTDSIHGAGLQSTGVLTAQPWQHSANLARMATLIAEALARLAPGQAQRLHANAAVIHHRLQQAEADTHLALARADSVDVLLLSPRVQVLANALQLDVLPWQPPADDAGLVPSLTLALQTHRPRVVLSHSQPDAAVAQAITQAGAVLVVLAENAPDPVQALAQAMHAIATAMQP